MVGEDPWRGLAETADVRAVASPALRMPALLAVRMRACARACVCVRVCVHVLLPRTSLAA